MVCDTEDHSSSEVERYRKTHDFFTNLKPPSWKNITSRWAKSGATVYHNHDHGLPGTLVRSSLMIKGLTAKELMSTFWECGRRSLWDKTMASADILRMNRAEGKVQMVAKYKSMWPISPRYEAADVHLVRTAAHTYAMFSTDLDESAFDISSVGVEDMVRFKDVLGYSICETIFPPGHVCSGECAGDRTGSSSAIPRSQILTRWCAIGYGDTQVSVPNFLMEAMLCREMDRGLNDFLRFCKAEAFATEPDFGCSSTDMPIVNIDRPFPFRKDS